MSRPKRYTAKAEFTKDFKFKRAGETVPLVAVEDKDGTWVSWEDYEALVQRNIRDHGDWRSKLNFLEADYKAEIARLATEVEQLNGAKRYIQILKEQNERLRNAGDALVVLAKKVALVGNKHRDIAAWNDAKEGATK